MVEFQRDRGVGRNPAQVPQKETKRVSDVSVHLADGLQNRIGYRRVVLIVHRSNPETQHVGPVLVRRHDRIDAVSEPLADFSTLAVGHESVGHNRFVRRDRPAAHAEHERAVEPSAVLVRAFEEQIGRIVLLPLGIHLTLQNAKANRARVEPHVQDVGFFLEFGLAGGRMDEARR